MISAEERSETFDRSASRIRRSSAAQAAWAGDAGGEAAGSGEETAGGEELPAVAALEVARATVASVKKAAAAEASRGEAASIGSTRARERALSAPVEAKSAASRGQSPPATAGVAGDGGGGAAAGIILARVPTRSALAEVARLATAAQLGAAIMGSGATLADDIPAGGKGSVLLSSQLSWLAARTRRANPLSSALVPARPKKPPPPPQPVRLAPFLRELPAGRREEGEVERRTTYSAAGAPCGGVYSKPLGFVPSLGPPRISPSTLGLIDSLGSAMADSPLSPGLLAAEAAAAAAASCERLRALAALLSRSAEGRTLVRCRIVA